MQGRTHALSGVAAALLAAKYGGDYNLAYVALAGVLGGGAAMLPDTDHTQGTAAVTWGPVTKLLTRAVCIVAGGHRQLTHSLIGAGVFAGFTYLLVRLRDTAPMDGWWQPCEAPLAVFLALLIGAGLRALHVGEFHRDNFLGLGNMVLSLLLGWVLAHAPIDLRWLPWIVGIGCLTHIAGDMCTVGGCPILSPLVKRDFWILPKRLRWRVSDDDGFIAEKHVVRPLLYCLAAWCGWQIVVATALLANFNLAGG